MKAKEGLNNVQRKMLDEIYTEQFKQKAQIILNERQRERAVLEDQIVKEESVNKTIKSILEAGKKFAELLEKHKEPLHEKGLMLTETITRVPELRLGSGRHYYSERTHPKLLKFDEATERIETDLAQKKKEIRARIYGMNTTYEEVDKEIADYIKDIK